MLFNGRFAGEKLVGNNRGLHAGYVCESRHRLAVERHLDFVGMPLRVIQENDRGRTRHGVAHLVAQHRLLVRFFQINGDEPRVAVKLIVLPHNGHGGFHLRCGQWIERMPNVLTVHRRLGKLHLMAHAWLLDLKTCGKIVAQAFYVAQRNRLSEPPTAAN